MRIADEASSAGIEQRPNNVALARLIWAVPVALILGATAFYGGMYFPVASIPLVVSLALYTALLWHDPRLWLFCVPALLPVLNFAPWSGRFFFDEFDLFLLVTVAVWIVRSASHRGVGFAPAAGTLILLFISSFAVSLALGVMPLGPVETNAFASYFSKYNGLRVGKGLVWGLVLAWLARSDFAKHDDALNRFWVPGMLTGLAGVVAVALWERMAFPGLLNFSEEYRITSTFGSMHVGGAAVDGYLALAVPFTLAWMADTRSPAKLAIAGALFALGTYTIIATFSRGLYLAYLVMIVVFALGTAIRQKAIGTFSIARAVAALLIVLALSFLFFGVFASGGYRALAALLGVLGLAFFLGRKAEKSGGAAPMLLATVALLVVNGILIKLFGKGAYAAYALSMLTGLMGVVMSLSKPHTSQHRLAWCGFIATAVAAVFVGGHWGGTPALMAVTTAVVFIFALLLVNRSLKHPLWQPNLKHAVTLAFIAAIFFTSIPIVGNSYFVGERFSDRSSAIRARMTHWRDTLGMIDNSMSAKAFGMGVGSFPGIFFWRSQLRAPSGTYQFANEGGNPFLKLGGHREGFTAGPTLYFAQRVNVNPYEVLKLSFDARTTSPKSRLQAGICESMLLYTQNCEVRGVAIAKSDGSWNTMTVSLNTKRLGSWHYFGKRPVQMWFVNPIAGTNVDIDNARLTDQFGNDLLHNGDFSQGGDRWLFSVSDFWPWHIENIWIHFLFEQGWLGLILFVFLLVYALCRLLMLAGRGQWLALVMLVSFAGFATVGTFNSLFEFPRVATLFYLLLFFSLLRWNVETPEAARTRFGTESSGARGDKIPRTASPEGRPSLARSHGTSRSRTQ